MVTVSHCYPVTLSAARRWALRSLAAAGLCVALLGPWPLDRAGFSDQPYYQESLRALESAAQKAVPAAGELRAGYGEVEITARAGEPLAGYGKR